MLALVPAPKIFKTAPPRPKNAPGLTVTPPCSKDFTLCPVPLHPEGKKDCPCIPDGNITRPCSHSFIYMIIMTGGLAGKPCRWWSCGCVQRGKHWWSCQLTCWWSGWWWSWRCWWWSWRCWWWSWRCWWWSWWWWPRCGYVVACEEESTGLFLELCERAAKVGTQHCADESDEDEDG